MQEKRSAQPTGSAEGSRNWVQIRINFIIRLDTDSSCLLMVWLCASNAKAVSQELNSEWFSRPVFFFSCALTNYCTARSTIFILSTWLVNTRNLHSSSTFCGFNIRWEFNRGQTTKLRKLLSRVSSTLNLTDWSDTLFSYHWESICGFLPFCSVSPNPDQFFKNLHDAFSDKLCPCLDCVLWNPC